MSSHKRRTFQWLQSRDVHPVWNDGGTCIVSHEVVEGSGTIRVATSRTEILRLQQVLGGWLITASCPYWARRGFGGARSTSVAPDKTDAEVERLHFEVSE